MSGELHTTNLVTPEPVAPIGHEQKMLDLVDSRNAAAANTERPEWLPDKFKTVEEMAASYKELEAKQSGKATGETPVVPTVNAPADAAAESAVAAAGLDMAALQAEYAKNGTLSTESFAALAAKGFDRQAFDNYVEGRQAVQAAFEVDVKGSTPGGADKYPEMMEWARVNLTPAEASAYNTAMDTSNKDQAKLAVAGLGARFSAAVGHEPNLQGGRTNGGIDDSFQSLAQMKVAMADPKYKSDPAYRRAVAQRLERSSIM